MLRNKDVIGVITVISYIDFMCFVRSCGERSSEGKLEKAKRGKDWCCFCPQSQWCDYFDVVFLLSFASILTVAARSSAHVINIIIFMVIMFYVFVLSAPADPVHISMTNSLITKLLLWRWNINIPSCVCVRVCLSEVFILRGMIPSRCLRKGDKFLLGNSKTNSSSEHKQAEVLIWTTKFEQRVWNL